MRGAEDWRKEVGTYETEDPGPSTGGGVRVIGREASGGLDRLVTGSYSGVLMLRFRLDGLGRDGRSRNVLTGLEHMLTELKK